MNEIQEVGLLKEHIEPKKEMAIMSPLDERKNEKPKKAEGKRENQKEERRWQKREKKGKQKMKEKGKRTKSKGKWKKGDIKIEKRRDRREK